MSLRVLFVITTLDVGGAEKHLRWLAQGLIERGATVDVVYLKGEGRLRPDFEALPARVTKIPFESPFGLVRTWFALASHIRRGRYDIVHTHLLKADALGALACLLAGHSALVASKHNEEQVLKRPLIGLIHGLLARRAGVNIALSDYVLEYVAATGRTPRASLRRIYYGIDPAPFAAGDRAATRARLGLAAHTHVGLCVARFHPQKDHATLFRAVRTLKQRGLDFRLLLAGGDPFYDHERALRAAVAELDIADRVDFLGIRDDIPDLLAACDVFVLPSLYEGLGLVFLEAMAAGRPVISTATTAIPEVVADGVTGRLIAVADDRALADAWAAWITDPPAARAMGERGRTRVAELFALPRMIDEVHAVYAHVLGRDPLA